MSKKTLSIVLFISLLFIGTSLQHAVRADESPILIASIFAHTGKAAEENSPNYLMTRLAAKRINEQGGVLGRPIKLIEIDNKSTAIGSHQAALQAIKAGVVAVVGPSWSSHAMSMAQVLQQARIPMIGATTTAPEVTQVGDYIFRACYTNQTQATVLAQFASTNLQTTKAAMMVVAGDVYSEDLATQFQTEYEKAGGVITAKELYILSAMDFEKQLISIRDSKPDIVFVPGFARDSGLILKQARNMGFTVPFIGGDGWTALEQYPHIQNLRGENYYISHWHHGNTSPASKDFIEYMKRELGPNALQGIDAGNPVAYDALSLVVDAIRRAESADPKAIRDALGKTTNFQGVTGNITYNGSRDPQKAMVILSISGKTVKYEQTFTPQQ